MSAKPPIKGDVKKEKENKKKEKLIAVTNKDVILRKAQLKNFFETYKKLEKEFKEKSEDLSKSLKQIDEMKFQINQKEEEMKRQNDFTLEMKHKKIEAEKTMSSMEKQYVEMEKYYIIMKSISSFLLLSKETEAASMFKAMRLMLACHFNNEICKCPKDLLTKVHSFFSDVNVRQLDMSPDANILQAMLSFNDDMIDFFTDDELKYFTDMLPEQNSKVGKEKTKNKDKKCEKCTDENTDNKRPSTIPNEMEFKRHKSGKKFQM